MKPIDLLLIAAIVLFTAAGFTLTTGVGLLSAGAGCAAAWFLLAEAPVK